MFRSSQSLRTRHIDEFDFMVDATLMVNSLFLAFTLSVSSASACEVTMQQCTELKMKITYAAAVKILGCEK
jgi:hypothetical protein